MASTVAAGSAVAKVCPASSLASAKNGVAGKALPAPAVRTVSVRQAAPVCRAQQGDESAVSRRATLAGLAAALTAASASPAFAAYGEAANVFGAAKKDSGFVTYSGPGFTFDLPNKWNPSKEIEYPGQLVRYEDNFDAISNLVVLAVPTSKSSIDGYGSPEGFIKEVSFLLGKQSYAGLTQSEGGFAKDQVATASVLESSEANVSGRKYYKLDVLTRTADGDEGGKHQLISATVADGKLYVFKIQAGDKRWFKGARKYATVAWDSFSVA